MRDAWGAVASELVFVGSRALKKHACMNRGDLTGCLAAGPAARWITCINMMPSVCPLSDSLDGINQLKRSLFNNC